MSRDVYGNQKWLDQNGGSDMNPAPAQMTCKYSIYNIEKWYGEVVVNIHAFLLPLCFLR